MDFDILQIANVFPQWIRNLVFIGVLAMGYDYAKTKFHKIKWNGENRRQSIIITLNEETIQKILVFFKEHNQVEQGMLDAIHALKNSIEKR